MPHGVGELGPTLSDRGTTVGIVTAGTDPLLSRPAWRRATEEKDFKLWQDPTTGQCEWLHPATYRSKKRDAEEKAALKRSSSCFQVCVEIMEVDDAESEEPLFGLQIIELDDDCWDQV